MNKAILIFVLWTSIFTFSFKNDFLTKQKKSERVRAAIKDKQDFIEKKLKEYQMATNNLNVLFVVYKDINLLEVYAKTKHVLQENPIV